MLTALCHPNVCFIEQQRNSNENQPDLGNGHLEEMETEWYNFIPISPSINCNNPFPLVGLTTSLPFRFPVVPLNSPKSTLNQKILNTLSNFIPAEKHFRTGQTDLGIEVDAEFIMNDKGIPLPLADYIGKALPDNSKR